MINYLLPSRAATVQQLGHPAAGVVGWMGGNANTTGVSVNAESALTFAAVWCAVRVISETIATLPCILYRKTSDDGRERMRDDPRYWLMHDEPHPEMSAVSFFESQTAHMVMQGNCYAKITESKQYPANLTIRRPDTVQPNVNGDSVYYEVTDPKETIYSPQMLHVAGLGGDGITGWSVVKYANQSIGGAMAGDQFAGATFGNGATPRGVMTIPTRLAKEAREQLRTEWNEIHQGADNSGKIAIMHGGMTYQPISMTNEDAQLLQSRQFSIRDIARWFRLPPHMLADLADSSVRANIEQQAIEFIIYSLKPWLVRWQQALNRKLLGEDERRKLYFEFLLESLLQGDSAAQAAAYSVGRQWGWLSVNEIRQRMNLPQIDGGDIYLQPANMVEAGAEPEPPPQIQPFPNQQPPPAADDEQVPAALKGEMQRNLTESINAILDSGKSLRADLEAGQHQLSESLASADAVAHEHIKTLREVREEIRRDLSEVGQRSQAQGWESEQTCLINACHDLLHSNLKAVFTSEKLRVMDHAKLVARGSNFVQWLDEFYAQHETHVSQRITDPVACYERLTNGSVNGLAKDIAHEIVMRHWSDLLSCCDGDSSGFMTRIQSLLTSWDGEEATINLEDFRHVA